MKKVLVIGDSMIDRYAFCGVERVSPEAPILVADFSKSVETPGGALNVVANINALSEGKVKISYLGYMTSDFKHECLKGVKFLAPLDSEPLIVKQRIVSDNKHLLRIDYKKVYSKPLAISLHDVDYKNFDLIIFSDYGKGTITNWGFFPSDLEIPIFADIKKWFVPTKNYVVKINAKEYEQMRTRLEEEAPYFIRTKGKEGYEIHKTQFPNSPKVFSYPAKANNEIIDVCGAGDVFLAGMAVRFLEKGYQEVNIDSLYDCANFGNAAASLSVRKFGTCVISRREFEEKYGKI